MPSSPGGASRLERNRITPYGKWLRPIPPGVEGNIEIGVRGTRLVTPHTTHPHGGLSEATILWAGGGDYPNGLRLYTRTAVDLNGCTPLLVFGFVGVGLHACAAVRPGPAECAKRLNNYFVPPASPYCRAMIFRKKIANIWKGFPSFFL